MNSLELSLETGRRYLKKGRVVVTTTAPLGPIGIHVSFGFQDGKVQYCTGGIVYRFKQMPGGEHKTILVRRPRDLCRRSGYWWECKKQAGTTGFCDEHKDIKCSVCGTRTATRECTVGSQYMECPKPLCDNCKCTVVDRWGPHDMSKRDEWKAQQGSKP